MKKSVLICIGLIFTLSGCQTNYFGAETAEWPWKKVDTTTMCSATCTPSDATRAFLLAANYCRSVQNYYESGGRMATNSQLAIGAVGVLAGSVMAPITKGTAAAAWSGLSGATNALQIPMQEAYSASISVRRRALIAHNAQEDIQKYSRENDSSKKIVLAIAMALNCSTGAATADESALKALSANIIPIPPPATTPNPPATIAPVTPENPVTQGK